jgi:molecular chaperone DnaK
MIGIRLSISRQEFATLTQDLTDRTFKVCDEALRSAGLLAADLDAVILVGGPTRLPMIREAVRDFFGKEPQCHLDPEEVVATGAAIHASSLMDTEQRTFLLDVTPLSLRLGISGGLAETVIEKNTPIPIEQTRSFTTTRDNQEAVSIRIYQGESRVAAENELLGEFEFPGLRPAKRGEVTIGVTFEINPEGIVNVIAKDVETGRRQATTVHLSSGLTEEEIRNAARNQDVRAAESSLEPAKETASTAPQPAVSPDPTFSPFDDDMPDLSPLAPSEELGPSPELLDLLGGMETDPEDGEKEDKGEA